MSSKKSQAKNQAERNYWRANKIAVRCFIAMMNRQDILLSDDEREDLRRACHAMLEAIRQATPFKKE